ncbi:MAG: hypothetical protein U0704_11545 [Candidatus Eisenbacteria bacterium]
MAANFHVDIARACVFSRVWGSVVDDDLFGHTFAIRAHPLFRPEFVQVMDYRDVKQVLVSTDCVRQLAEHNPWAREARRALVMNQALLVGLGRMYQLSGAAPAEGVAVCGTWEEAMRWVGLPDDTGWPAQPEHWRSAAQA